MLVTIAQSASTIFTIEKGGVFEKIAKAMIADGFEFTWASIPMLEVVKTKRGQRTKYECSNCHAAVWGKDGLSIDCNTDGCDITMDAVKVEEGDDD